MRRATSCGRTPTTLSACTSHRRPACRVVGWLPQGLERGTGDRGAPLLISGLHRRSRRWHVLHAPRIQDQEPVGVNRPGASVRRAHAEFA